MQWTSQTPTAPGWYWYQDDDLSDVVLQIDWTGFVDINDPGARQLQVMWPESEDGIPVDITPARPGAMWAGPIAPPAAENYGGPAPHPATEPSAAQG